MPNDMQPPKQAGKSEFIAVLTDPGKNPQAKGQALAGLVDTYSADLTGLLPAHVKFERMKQLFVLSCKQTPKLLDCDPGSLIKALFTAASMGLEPDPYFGQIYLLPYGKTVQVIPGYKGLLQLVRNSGTINSIVVESVYPYDHFEYDMANGQRPSHRPNLTDRGGEAIAFYCIANFSDGGFHFELMNRTDVIKVRNASAGYKAGKSSPWHEHFDEMAKKTVLRRAVKRLPISLDRQLRTVLKADDAAHAGLPFQVDERTGEALDIWSEPIDPDAPTPPPAIATSRLEQFEGEYTETHNLNPDTGELEPKPGASKAK